MSMPAEILVVDDDYDIRDTMTEILSDHGYAVASAANGQDAIEWLRANGKPHLVLLDWMMPVCDGPCFLRRQLADPALSSIPVVIVTAAPIERVANDAPDVEACLRKPVDVRTMLALIQRYVFRPPPSSP